MMPGVDGATVDRRRPRRVALFAIVAIATLLAVAVFVTAGPVFRIRTVRVRGAQHLTRDQVLRLAGISAGSNLLRLSGASATRSLERDAWVASATISKDLPSTVTIVVRERIVVAMSRVAGVMRLVAADGTLLDGGTGDALLPTIGPVKGGPEPSAQAVAGAARAIAAMTPDTRAQVAGVAILPDDSLLVRLSGGAIVTYGAAEELPAKAVALRALLRWAAGRGEHLSAGDVHVPSNPTAEAAPGPGRTP